ncbi:MAG TPA: hypothetical protein VEB21_21200 [Terriglobales bacterium]|nr:hypothetical protein [Terriglobales bacterium]
MSTTAPSLVELSPSKFVLGCVAVAVAILATAQAVQLPVMLLGIEVLATILGLFIFGSIRYRLDKNALTYGALLVVLATFWGVWCRLRRCAKRFRRKAGNPSLRRSATTCSRSKASTS